MNIDNTKTPTKSKTNVKELVDKPTDTRVSQSQAGLLYALHCVRMFTCTAYLAQAVK